MNILQLHLQNLKAFADERFCFNPHFTVIIGENGEGKTALLNGVQIALGAYLQCLGFGRGYTRNITKADICYIWNPKSKDYEPKLPTRVSVQGVLSEVGIDWSRTQKTKDGKTTHNKRETGALMDMVAQLLARSKGEQPLPLPVMAHFGVRRGGSHIKITQKHGRRSRLEKAYYGCLSDSAENKEYARWLYDYDSLIKQQKEFEGTREAVFAAIATAIPYLSDIAYHRYEKQLEAVVSRRDGQQDHLLLSMMSDGFRTMVELVAELAYRCVLLNGRWGTEAVLRTPGVVMIDELDMHLHPSWQRHVVADLKKAFPMIQFIATTHSPFIVQSLASDELINLNYPSDVALLDWDNMLLSCAPCNNAKTNHYLPPADFYLPEVHNVLLAFDCHIPAPGHAVVQPAEGLSAMQQQKASDTIGVFKWANIERRDKAVDLRTEKRYEVMLSAQFCDQQLSELTELGARAHGIALVALAAQGKGFFSVWYRQFEQQPDVLAELLKVFPGTDIRCFDATTYRAQPRNPGQADPI